MLMFRSHSPFNHAQRANVAYHSLFTVDLPIGSKFSVELPKENAWKTCAIDQINDVEVSSGVIVNGNCDNMQMKCSREYGF